VRVAKNNSEEKNPDPAKQERGECTVRKLTTGREESETISHSFFQVARFQVMSLLL